MSKAHWLALTTLSGVGSVTLRRLLDRFGDLAAVFDAPDRELLSIPRVTPDVVAHLHAISLDVLSEEIASLSDEGITVLTWEDEGFPAPLRPLPDAPPVLFVRGEVRRADELAVAIVGTREPTPRAREWAEGLACEVAARGVTVVSGLALGIDTAAHQGALAAPSGRTLAILGSGIRVVHPRENRDLAERIIQRGALLSEFHPATPPRGPQLMARDRIVSGLSRAVIVVEAGEKSGSLDTAARARRQGRPVFAVPGSPGTDALLAQGAETLDITTLDSDAFVRRLTSPSPDAPPPPTQLGLW